MNPPEATSRACVLGRYDAEDLLAMFREEGVVDAIRARGFDDLAFAIDTGEGPLTHARLSGARDGGRHLLLDACLTLARIDEKDRAHCRYTGPLPLDLLVVYWLREQDPTAAFEPGRPRLPLQEHPGLGVLRLSFRIAVRLARQLGCDAVAALPKYFHDAAIFYRSRLFLFLDPAEQGRLEALLRDLEALTLADATIAVGGGAVRDAGGATLSWMGGLQVLPLSAPLASHFHSPGYQAACREAFARSRFTVDGDALAAARRVFESGAPPA